MLPRADAEGNHYLVRVRATANNPGSSGYAAVVKSEGVPLVGDQEGQHDLGPTVSINTAVSKTTLNVAWNSISSSRCPKHHHRLQGQMVSIGSRSGR